MVSVEALEDMSLKGCECSKRPSAHARAPASFAAEIADLEIVHVRQGALSPMTAVVEHRSQLPNTIMADAFLRALVAWAARQHGARGRVKLPAGRVDGDELARVILALLRARSKSRALRHPGALEGVGHHG